MPTPSRSSPADGTAFDRSAHGGLHRIAELARRSLGCTAAVVRVFAAADEGERNAAVCAAAIAPGDEPSGDIADPCSLADPLAAGDLGFGFYAGIPLRTSGGETMGVLAAVGREPHELTDGELETLNLLAAVAVELVEARLAGQR